MGGLSIRDLLNSRLRSIFAQLGSPREMVPDGGQTHLSQSFAFFSFLFLLHFCSGRVDINLIVRPVDGNQRGPAFKSVWKKPSKAVS